jgi:hypothetical protein
MNRPIVQRAILILAPALALALFVLCLYAPLLFTNRVLASGDILHYFVPYRDYAAASLRGGHIPLWNPYIFLGVPFLANPQAAALYPLHWPLIWLPVTKQIYWSAALHTWLLGLGGYWLLRRWGAGGWAALAGGLVLCGSGFVGGLLGHINQLNGVAWLPWLLLALDAADLRRAGRRWASWVWAALWLSVTVCLMFLAGHTQTVYINLVGAGVWALWLGIVGAASNRTSIFHGRVSSRQAHSQQDQRAVPNRAYDSEVAALGGLRAVCIRLLVYTTGVALGIAMSSAQLLPSLELSRLGLRSGGLPYLEASSFSLKPLHLLWTLLPSYGLADLSVVFDTLSYTEFVAYVGLAGLALALVGAWRGQGALRSAGLLFAALGLFLAAGRWNPVYYLLYLVAPGFDLFRAPARWMMLYTVGMAALAAAGVEVLLAQRHSGAEGLAAPLSGTRTRTRQPSSALGVLLTVLVSLELLLAARALPHTQTTAPQAVYDLRTAPAHLLTDPERLTLGAAAGRFLSMSTITFDPGDMQDLRRIFQGEGNVILDERAFEQLIIALKAHEILAPNLALFWRIPSVDGFDGGVLPLRRYIDFLSLMIAPEELVPDGRLREQLRNVPDTSLLGLLNVDYLITDKVRDLWFEDIFYDRQIGARLRASTPESAPAEIQIDAAYPFEATQLDIIGYIEGETPVLTALQDDAVAVAEVLVEQGDGVAEQFALTAGGQPGAHFADGDLGSALAASSGAIVAWRDVEQGRAEYLARFPLNSPVAPTQVRIRRASGADAAPLDLVIQAVTLVDGRTGMFEPLLPSDRGRFRLAHSGDVKVYENLDARPRAYLAHNVVGVADAAGALAYLRAHRPEMAASAARTAVVEGVESFSSEPAADDEARILAYAPEEVQVRTRSHEPALLVLADSFYPGWTAAIDGEPAPIYATNALVRGVRIPAGEHTVVFRYAPASWRAGAQISAAALVIWLGALIGCLVYRIRRPIAPDV